MTMHHLAGALTSVLRGRTGLLTEPMGMDLLLRCQSFLFIFPLFISPFIVASTCWERIFLLGCQLLLPLLR